ERHQMNLTEAEPSPPMDTWRESPAATGTKAPSDPERITSPARSGIPNRPSALANQATQVTGEPSAAAPAPVHSRLPFFSNTIPHVDRSTLLGSTARSPRTNMPAEALSATVSCNLIRQSRILESTISKHGITKRVAYRTSALLIPGPVRSRSSRNATSPSALGCNSVLTEMVSV